MFTLSKHVLYVQSCLNSEEPVEELETFMTVMMQNTNDSTDRNSSGISWKKTPFQLPDNSKTVLRIGIQHFLPINSDSEVVLKCNDDETCSSCGCALTTECVHLPVIMEKSVLNAEGIGALKYCDYNFFIVQRKKCSNIKCGLVFHFDGIESGLVNMGVRLVSYDVVRSYMHHFFACQVCFKFYV